MTYPEPVSQNTIINQIVTELSMSRWDKIVMGGFLLLIITILAISGWSLILIASGQDSIESPVGFAMRVLVIPLLNV